MASTFFTDIGNTVDLICNAFVLTKAQAVMSAISPVATTLFTIYVMLWGLAVMRGAIQEPIFDMVMRMVKMGVVLGIALSMGNYQTFVHNFLWNTPDDMAKVFMGAPGTGVAGILDTLYTQNMTYGDSAWGEMGFANGFGENIGYFLIASIAYIAAILITGYAAFLIVLSKLGLAIMLAVGPIAILLTMFQGTQKFFESWLGLSLNYVWMTVLTATVVSLTHLLVGSYVEGVVASGEIKIIYSLQLLLLAAICCLVLMQVQSMSSSLGGGAGLSTMGMAGAAWSKATGQFRAKPRYKKNSSTGKREISDYRSNAGVAMKAAGAPIRAAKNLYRSSQRNSISNG